MIPLFTADTYRFRCLENQFAHCLGSMLAKLANVAKTGFSLSACLMGFGCRPSFGCLNGFAPSSSVSYLNRF